MTHPMDTAFDLAAAILADEQEGMTMFGKPIRFVIEWPEGMPPGWTAEQLRELGRRHLHGWGLTVRLPMQMGGWVGQAND
jgi:hypothetical protein